MIKELRSGPLGGWEREVDTHKNKFFDNCKEVMLKGKGKINGST